LDFGALVLVALERLELSHLFHPGLRRRRRIHAFEEVAALARMASSVAIEWIVMSAGASRVSFSSGDKHFFQAKGLRRRATRYCLCPAETKGNRNNLRFWRF